MSSWSAVKLGGTLAEDAVVGGLAERRSAGGERWLFPSLVFLRFVFFFFRFTY